MTKYAIIEPDVIMNPAQHSIPLSEVLQDGDAKSTVIRVEERTELITDSRGNAAPIDVSIWVLVQYSVTDVERSWPNGVYLTESSDKVNAFIDGTIDRGDETGVIDLDQ